MKAFECRMCGECCYGEGGIYLSQKEQDRLARFLSIPKRHLFPRYVEERNGRIYVRVGEDNFCVFYEKGVGCTIHSVKPDRCSLWPFYPANVADEETWNMAKLACRGLNRECSFDDFVREARSATGTTPKDSEDE